LEKEIPISYSGIKTSERGLATILDDSYVESVVEYFADKRTGDNFLVREYIKNMQLLDVTALCETFGDDKIVNYGELKMQINETTLTFKNVSMNHVLSGLRDLYDKLPLSIDESYGDKNKNWHKLKINLPTYVGETEKRKREYKKYVKEGKTKK
jgi:hypothetical protein